LRRFEAAYQPLVDLALGGDAAAVQALAASPRKHRVPIGWLLIAPLIDDRDPDRITATREIAASLSLVTIAEQYMASRWWWRRALALRALGLMQQRSHTGDILNGLDDRDSDVRGAALDALADLQDPASLPTIVARLHDTSLHRGRRAALIAAFGAQCEPFLLTFAERDFERRLNYAQMLAICGTARSRPALCEWTADPRPGVRAAAFAALAHVGLDDRSAGIAIQSLDSADLGVRAMAAHALHGWTGAGDAAGHLARHLDDTWAVAVRAAESLAEMREIGRAELATWSQRAGLPGLLARQMLWQAR
jgi:HEAT repeat protein